MVLFLLLNSGQKKQKRLEEQEQRRFEKQIHRERQQRQEEERRREEENRRRLSIPCRYEDGFTKEQFEQTVYKCAKRIKRIRKVEINGLIIKCTVESQSGVSDWSFKLDFHDYGHYTGKCICYSDNPESPRDKRLRDLIIEELRVYTDQEKND